MQGVSAPPPGFLESIGWVGYILMTVGCCLIMSGLTYKVALANLEGRLAQQQAEINGKVELLLEKIKHLADESQEIKASLREIERRKS